MDDITRPNKVEYYLNITRAVSQRGTCLRRNYGAVIVKHDEIISTGYTGAPRGWKNCIDIGTCYRQKHNIPRGTCYEMSRSVHAEMNAIISASRSEMMGSTLFLYGYEMDTKEQVENILPCSICKKMIINAGISFVVAASKAECGYTIYIVDDWIMEESEDQY